MANCCYAAIQHPCMGYLEPNPKSLKEAAYSVPHSRYKVGSAHLSRC